MTTLAAISEALRLVFVGEDEQMPEGTLDAARARLDAVARTQGTTVSALLRAHGAWNGDDKPLRRQIADALDATAGVLVEESAAEPPENDDKANESKPVPLRARRLDIGAMMRTPAPQIDMVLRGLPLGSCGVILGSGGIGKSMLVLHVAAAVATGRDDLGCLLGDGEHLTGRVVYLAGEDDEVIIHHRVRAFAEHADEERRDDLIAAMHERVDIIPLVGTAPTLVDGGGSANDEALAQIREEAKGARLLVIDPLRQFHSADENDNGAMTTLSKALAQIAHEERCSIVVVHHVSKHGAKDEDADAAMSRGATAITDNARWVMALRKITEDACERDGLDGEAWQYLRQSLVKANYVALGNSTTLRRCDGGVLAQVMVRARDVVGETLAQIAAPVPSVQHVAYDDRDGALDPRTGEPFPQRPKVRGFEDADLFGAD